MGMIYFQIEEEKAEKVTQHLEKGIHYIEKAMQCVEDMMQGGSMGERSGGGSAGYRGGGMGYREGGMGYRDGGSAGFRDDDDDEMGFRRGVKGTGPYSRFRRGYASYREPYMM